MQDKAARPLNADENMRDGGMRMDTKDKSQKKKNDGKISSCNSDEKELPPSLKPRNSKERMEKLTSSNDNKDG